MPDTAYLADEYAVEINLDLLTRQLSVPDSGLAQVPESEPADAESEGHLMVLSRGERLKLAIGVMKRDVLQDLTVAEIAVTWKMFEPENRLVTLGYGTPVLEGTGTNDRRYVLEIYADPAQLDGILRRGTGPVRTGVDGYLQIELVKDGAAVPQKIVSHSAKVRIYRDH